MTTMLRWDPWAMPPDASSYDSLLGLLAASDTEDPAPSPICGPGVAWDTWIPEPVPVEGPEAFCRRLSAVLDPMCATPSRWGTRP